MKQIEITLAQHATLEKRLFIVNNLSNLLNEFLMLSDFTKSFNTLFFIFQCFPKDIKSRKVVEFKIIRRKTKTLELYLILDYERIMQGTDSENLQHIKEVFLKGCETFLKPLKDFKWEEFNYEVQKIIHR